MSDKQEGSRVEDVDFERHRPILRKLEKRLSTVYGLGGTVIFAVGVLIPAIFAWKFHLFAQPLLYIISVVLILFGFYLLRMLVRKEKEILKTQYHSYCEVNELDPEALRRKIISDDTYNFVASAFDAPLTP